MYALRASGHKDSSDTRHVLFESDPACRQVLEKRLCSDHVLLSNASDTQGLVGSVLALTDSDCTLLIGILDSLPNLLSVLIVGGFPCQGLSRANPRRALLEDSRSVLVWVFAVLVARARSHAAACRSKFSVHFLVENVVTEPQAESAITALLGAPAQKIDAALWSPISRPRTFWTSLGPCILASRRDIDAASVLQEGWRPLWELEGAPANTPHGHRWCTLTRPFPPGKPSEFPAQYPRHSLGMYTEFGLAYKTDSSEEHLAQIRALVLKSMRLPASAKSQLRIPNSEAVRLRGAVPQAIHAAGLGSHLRPLSAAEAEAALGYPGGASKGSQTLASADSSDWDRLAHLGNGFSVPVVSALLRPFSLGIAKGSLPPVVGHGPSAFTEAEALSVLALGGPRRRPLPPRPVAHPRHLPQADSTL